MSTLYTNKKWWSAYRPTVKEFRKLRERWEALIAKMYSEQAEHFKQLKQAEKAKTEKGATAAIKRAMKHAKAAKAYKKAADKVDKLKDKVFDSLSSGERQSALYRR